MTAVEWKRITKEREENWKVAEFLNIIHKWLEFIFKKAEE